LNQPGVAYYPLPVSQGLQIDSHYCQGLFDPNPFQPY